MAIVAVLAACGEPFDPASRIDKQRFLAVVVEPLAALPGEEIVFSAAITEKDGSLYDGPIVWVLAAGEGVPLGVQEAGDAGLVWTVPTREALAALVGPPARDGWLLTVLATAFAGGELDGEPRVATKTFVIRADDQGEPPVNPRLDEIAVTTEDGDAVPTDQDGAYRTGSRKLNLRAVPDEDADDMTYHWFSTSKDFEPDLEASQTFEADGTGRFAVYCVLRRPFIFTYDRVTKGRVYGEDWRRIEIVVTE